MYNNLNFIYQNYYHRIQKLKLKISASELRDIVNKESLKAEENYYKLPKLKTCSLDTYICLWVKESLDNKLALKTLRKVDLQNPKDSLSESLASFIYYLPQELIPSMRKRVFSSSFLERKNIWQDFNLPLNEVEKKFKDLIEARIEDVSERNYSSFFAVFLEKYQISQELYNQFVKGVDRLIADLNSELPRVKSLPSWFYSEFNLPCFICQLPDFPFKSIEEVFGFVEKEYPLLREFKQKVKVSFTQEEKTFTVYKTRQDIIEISLGEEANIRHLAIALIHELGHAISLLDYLRKGEEILFAGGKLEAEKRAIEIETNLLRKISEDLYKATLGEVLLFPFRNTLFEIELYKNPKCDVSRLYAKTFNRCFLKARQEDNPLYLLDEKIIFEPFALLPHAVARYQLLKEDV